MKRLLICLLSLLAGASLAVAAAAAPGGPTARTGAGMVSGVASGAVEKFLGIPYARPPVGELRWRAPQPAVAWGGVRSAANYGHDCMQERVNSASAPVGSEPNEDCLVVNVWRPAGAKPGAKLPVLVWIYGGGDVNGGSSTPTYAGEAVARDGVIMVSYNYRVGRFGWFAFPALSKENPDKGQLGNYAYMDSLAAMKWVQRNIGAFGGDPAKVTIYGQSAGAGQVAMLISSPLSRNLFRGAIIQSGGQAAEDKPLFRNPDGTSPIEQAGVAFAKRWGIEGTGPEALAKLRALKPEQVVDGLRMGVPQRTTFGGDTFDGTILRESLVSAVVGARQNKTPLIIGSTTGDHFGSMSNTKTLDQAFSGVFAPAAQQARAAYLTNPAAAPDYLIREMGRDISYNEPVRFIATRSRAQGVPVYTYRFGYVPEAMKTEKGEWEDGPPHAADIAFALDTLGATRYGGKLTATDQSMARQVHAYWMNFVKTGDPNGPDLARWPAYDRGANELMIFGRDGTAKAIRDPYAARIDAVSAVLNRN